MVRAIGKELVIRSRPHSVEKNRGWDCTQPSAYEGGMAVPTPEIPVSRNHGRKASAMAETSGYQTSIGRPEIDDCTWPLQRRTAFLGSLWERYQRNSHRQYRLEKQSASWPPGRTIPTS